MEQPLIIKSQEPMLGSLPTIPTSTSIMPDERLRHGIPLNPSAGGGTLDFSDKFPRNTYPQEQMREAYFKYLKSKKLVVDYMEKEAPWQLPRWLRPYYEYTVSEYFSYFSKAWGLIDQLIAYLLLIYIFFLVLLFVKRLFIKHKPLFMVSRGFVGDMLWYVKDKQIYHKFKLFYLINLFIFIFAVFLMVSVFVDIFRIVQNWEVFFYFTHVNYRVPYGNGNQTSRYLHPTGRFFSKREVSTIAGINRKRFVEMLYYPKNNLYVRSHTYAKYEIVQIREEGYFTRFLHTRPYVTKLDRMVFNIPRIWVFRVLPYDKPLVPFEFSAPR